MRLSVRNWIRFPPHILNLTKSWEHGLSSLLVKGEGKVGYTYVRDIKSADLPYSPIKKVLLRWLGRDHRLAKLLDAPEGAVKDIRSSH